MGVVMVVHPRLHVVKPTSPAIPRLPPTNHTAHVSKRCRLVTHPGSRYFLAIFVATVFLFFTNLDIAGNERKL
jgi:hypothetical protein